MVKTAAGRVGPKERTMTTRVHKRVEVLGDDQDKAVRAAVTVAMIGLLVGLSAFFVIMAPHV